jgi:hypothetical protein
MSSTTEAPSQLSGSVVMYRTPEPLNVQSHGALGLVRRANPFDFARNATAVPIQVTEFGPAGLNYPLIFAGEDKTPLAVLGVRADENLFVTAEGVYEPEAYIPGFIRRYPFVLANDQAQGRLVVCLDRSASFVTPDGEIRLFENGEPSAYTREAIKFCEDFETERQRTDFFVGRLKALDLFETKQAFFTPRDETGASGEPVQIADYFAVSEAKVNALSPEVLAELRDSGALRQIYAHLDSLFGWDRLITRAMLRTPTVGNA